MVQKFHLRKIACFLGEKNLGIEFSGKIKQSAWFTLEQLKEFDLIKKKQELLNTASSSSSSSLREHPGEISEKSVKGSPTTKINFVKENVHSFTQVLEKQTLKHFMYIAAECPSVLQYLI